jgi:hypothetical protein
MVSAPLPLVEKAWSPMLVTLGMDTVVRDVQLAKALCPMLVASGKDTVVRAVH